MIIDRIEKLMDYASLNPLFPKAIEYINSIDFNKPSMGIVELDGKNLFAIISESDLKEENDAKLEVHNEYIDIQLPLSKPEGFGWSARAELKAESSPFDVDRDVQFFEDKPTMYFDLQPGCFTILFPQDAHAPCIGDNTVIKVVIKVKVNL